jgi:plastocyanin
MARTLHRGDIVVTDTYKQIATHLAVASGLALAVACGGGGTSPSPNPGGGGGSGSAGPVGATITIGANGAVSPASVTINSGESVRFVNNHNRTHQMSSDPHPNHTDCPPMNVLPTLDPGQSGQTNGLTTSRTCGFHDHLNDTDANLRGTIVIR